MKRILYTSLATVILLAGVLLGLTVHSVKAQTINVPFSYSVGTATHTSCPAVVAATTQYCFPSDGPFVSVDGGAWQAIPLSQAPAGVASLSVNGGAPQTGAVAITVPISATLPAQTLTLK